MVFTYLVFQYDFNMIGDFWFLSKDKILLKTAWLFVFYDTYRTINPKRNRCKIQKVNPQKNVVTLFRKRRVVTMDDLREVVGSSSRMTVFRRLSQIEYISSYTHAGRYYTLYDIARFDSDGLWFYDDIGFSQKGSFCFFATVLPQRKQYVLFSKQPSCLVAKLLRSF